jgi:RNA polymerase sigma factor for flagellar operon FliA
MKEIGAVLGYTESRISQIHTKALLKLKTRLARRLRADDLPGIVQGELRLLQPKHVHLQPVSAAK